MTRAIASRRRTAGLPLILQRRLAWSRAVIYLRLVAGGLCVFAIGLALIFAVALLEDIFWRTP